MQLTVKWLSGASIIKHDTLKANMHYVFTSYYHKCNVYEYVFSMSNTQTRCLTKRFPFLTKCTQPSHFTDDVR